MKSRSRVTIHVASFCKQFHDDSHGVNFVTLHATPSGPGPVCYSKLFDKSGEIVSSAKISGFSGKCLRTRDLCFILWLNFAKVPYVDRS